MLRSLRSRSAPEHTLHLVLVPALALLLPVFGLHEGGGPSSPARSSVPSSAGWVLETGVAGSEFGDAAGGAGDVNGDGYTDVIVGAHSYSNGEPSEGQALLYLGSATGLRNTPDWSVESNLAYARLGRSVAGAGDVNGDGYDDVVVGASSYDAGLVAQGRAFLYLGSAGGLGTTAAWAVSPNQQRATFGTSVAGAGDVNGDGFDDVIVGAPNYDNVSQDGGRAWVYLGSPAGLATEEDWSVGADLFGSRFGATVAGAGDVNGDGYDDVVVSAPSFPSDDQLQARVGAAFLYLGSPTGLATTPAWSATGSEDGAFFGAEVAGAGDPDGDGYDDVLVGAVGFSNPESGEGRAYLYRGSAAGLSATHAWAVESNQTQAFLGSSVAGTGDVDGDGYDDVAVGAEWFTNGGLAAGAVFVYHGSPSGPSPTADWTSSAVPPNSQLGTRVRGLGDVDGDGYADLAGGANLYGAGAGIAFVWAGSAAGLGDLVAATSTSRNAGTNPRSLVATLPKLGRTWTATVDLTTTGHTHAGVVLRTFRESTTLPGGQTVLVSGSSLASLPIRPGPSPAWSAAIPPDPSLCGLALHAQAVHLSGVTPFALSNALDLVVGW